VLIGFRYGGLVAWWLSLIAPHRIEKLIIVGSIPSLRYFPRIFQIALRWPFSLLCYWRNRAELERLHSVLCDFPLQPPPIPTIWIWSREDSYHTWSEHDCIFTDVNWRIVDTDQDIYLTIERLL